MKKLVYIIFIFLAACGGATSSPKEAGPDVPGETMVSTVQYLLDDDSCLIDDNSESTLYYDNGMNKAKTLLWNCADYVSFTEAEYIDSHVELFFLSTDSGICYRLATYYTTDGMCDTEAEAVNNPIYAADILDVQGGFTGNEFSYALEIQNNSDVVLLNTYYSVTMRGTFFDTFGNIKPFNVKVLADKITSVHLPMTNTVTEERSIVIDDIGPGIYEMRYDLFLWDGTFLDSHVKEFISGI